MLEVKLEYFKHIIKQKQQIKASSNAAPGSSSGASESATTAAQSQSADHADNQEESKTEHQWRVPCMESIEENIVSKNSFCIMIGAYLR